MRDDVDNLRTLHDLARGQRGLVDRASARQLGVADGAIDRLLARRILLPIHPGVHRLASTDLTWEARLHAALLAAGPDAVASHRSAARLHGLRRAAGTDVVELTTHGSAHPSLIGVLLHRTTWSPAAHRTAVDGLAVTSIDRTLADIGAVVPYDAASDAVVRAVIERKTTLPRLFHLVDAHGRPGRRGLGTLRRVLETWIMGDKPPDSVLEVLLARLVDASGLPMPSFQHEIRDARGRFVARVDAAWPDQRVVAEVDGFTAHATPEDLQSDLRRQNRLARAGWHVLRFTKRDLVQDRAATIDHLAVALGRRVA